MLRIRNEELVDVITFLEGFELQPKVSRVRTKLGKLIRQLICYNVSGRKTRRAISSKTMGISRCYLKRQLNIIKKRQIC
ncbi:hypothetical protein ACI48T_002480 [Listeria monocytogenes]